VAGALPFEESGAFRRWISTSRPGDSTWRALALEVLRIEDGLITEIVVFPPDSFPAFRLPMMMDAPPEMNKCH
jgi:hypothetical protein